MGRNGGSGGPPETARAEPALAEPGAEGPGRMGGMIREYFDRLRRRPGHERAAQPPVPAHGLGPLSPQLPVVPRARRRRRAAGIPSYLDAVRGSSPTLIRQRLEARGTPVSDAFVAQLAAGGEKDLRDRLLHGGKQMPAFPHLAGAEVDALLHYLKQQAGVPEATGPDLEVDESVARVGEHLVKGTCHVCHDATGPGSGHMMMMRGTIPSLASFPEEKSPDDLIRKVRYGASGMMGMMGGGRMPTSGISRRRRSWPPTCTWPTTRPCRREDGVRPHLPSLLLDGRIERQVDVGGLHLGRREVAEHGHPAVVAGRHEADEIRLPSRTLCITCMIENLRGKLASGGISPAAMPAASTSGPVASWHVWHVPFTRCSPTRHNVLPHEVHGRRRAGHAGQRLEIAEERNRPPGPAGARRTASPCRRPAAAAAGRARRRRRPSR